MGGSVPDRWTKYSPHGRVMIGKFIALKVPLWNRNNLMPRKEQFTPEDAMERIPLGLIIDLTNTHRYYNPREFTSRGIDHVKIPVPGRILPKMHLLQRFNDIANGYFNDPGSKGKLIGVHCTHGLNRTGYFVCAYLITELGYHPMDAINLFNETRGHRMEREHYLASLQNMLPGSGASGPRNDVIPTWERSTPSRPNYTAPSRTQQCTVNNNDRTSWRQDRSQRPTYVAEPRNYNVDTRRQQDRTYRQHDIAPYRYASDNNRNSEYRRGSPEHNQEKWDPTIRRIVRPRQHNFRLPSHRQTLDAARHTKFE